MTKYFNIDTWVIWGLLAQFIFFLRFFVQWIASEKAKKSVIPIQFWYLSLIGSTMLFIYACHRRDIVFIIGQSSGLIIYIRNLVFIYREKNEKNKPI